MNSSIARKCTVTFILAAFGAALGHAQFHQHNMVSDGFVPADTIDADLKNPWGIAMSATSPFWVANQVTGTATLYNGAGIKQTLTVDTTSNPTGTVFNPNSTDFLLAGTNNAARFLFVTLGGRITGWNPNVDPTHAVVQVASTNAVYTGLELASSQLFAANALTGMVDVYDNTFQLTKTLTDPNAPSGFAPYNVRAFGSSLYVTYSKEEDIGGFVDEFTISGNFVRRVVAQTDDLAEAWGMEIAPASFGSLAGTLLVGSVGTGKILAYDRNTGALVGSLQENGVDLVNDGLWGITVGNGGNGGDPNKLYFAAGLNDEQDGLFGSIEAVPEPGLMVTLGVGLLALVRRRRR